jgi:hypothetical protein
MDGTGSHKVKQNKQEPERQASYVLSHMQKLVFKNYVSVKLFGEKNQ